MNQQEKIVKFAEDATKEIVAEFTVNPSSSRVTPIADTMLRLEITEKREEKDAQISFIDGKVNEWFPKQEALQEIAQQLAQTKIPGWTQMVHVVEMLIKVHMVPAEENEEIAALQTILVAIGEKCNLLVTPIQMPESQIYYYGKDTLVSRLKIRISAKTSDGNSMVSSYQLNITQQRIGDLMHHLGWRSNSGWEPGLDHVQNSFSWVNRTFPNWSELVSPIGNVASKVGYHTPHHPHLQYPGVMHPPGVFGMPPGGSPYFSADSFKEAGVGVPPNLTPQQVGELYQNPHHPLNPFARHSGMPMEHMHGFAHATTPRRTPTMKK